MNINEELTSQKLSNLEGISFLLVEKLLVSNFQILMIKNYSTFFNYEILGMMFLYNFKEEPVYP
jgi:hypothetical protein